MAHGMRVPACSSRGAGSISRSELQGRGAILITINCNYRPYRPVTGHGPLARLLASGHSRFIDPRSLMGVPLSAPGEARTRTMVLPSESLKTDAIFAPGSTCLHPCSTISATRLEKVLAATESRGGDLSPMRLPRCIAYTHDTCTRIFHALSGLRAFTRPP